MRGSVVALVGAQFGSEGKGVVAYHMRNDFDISIRTGAPNAGHSFVHRGQLYKMQTIPCGWPNKDCLLVLGAGALINLKLLQHEIDIIKQVDPDIEKRLFIDINAGILEERHHEEEGGIHGEMHLRMGSTGEGVGPARRDRIMRDPAKFRLAKHVPELLPMLNDTVPMLNISIKSGRSALLEGTQGTGLSLVHGKWPHVTSSDTNAAQLAADAGIPPQWVDKTILVARTYPIRVAGPSGELKNELTWEEMSQRVNRPVEERTTVTKKVRRIGEWDEDLFRKSVQLNAPESVALTFMDYLSPEDRNKTSYSKLTKRAQDFVYYVERTFKVKVSLIGTGWSESEGWVCVDRR